MNAKLALCTLLLLILLFQGSCHDEAAGVGVGVGVQQPHSHSDPSSSVFFFLDELKIGNSIPVYFPKRELSDSLPHLLSKEEADSIPFSLHHLPLLLRLFSFSDDSPQATAMRETLSECDRNPIEGETKTCATSTESLSKFLQTIFGSDTPIQSLSTTHLQRSDDGDARVPGDHRAFVNDFEPRPSVTAYVNGLKPTGDHKTFVNDFEPRPSVTSYVDGLKPAGEHNAFVNDFEPRPSVTTYVDGLKPAGENNAFVNDFEPRPSVTSYVDGLELAGDHKTFVNDFEPRPSVTAYIDGLKPASDHKAFVNNFEPRPSVTAYVNGLKRAGDPFESMLSATA